MAKVTIDGKVITVDDNASLIQACELASIEIPHFCYHDRLKIAGNCRMCLVEVEGSPKPVASCAMPVRDGMVVHTTTPMVKQAREDVMSMLLANHPLDCPICDQGGECDLQDQAMHYGDAQGHYNEDKRAVTDKNMGPLIKTVMTRCIHCTRCVRFATEIAGVEEIGTFGRGENMEIITYLDKAISSELSGNLVDICPVGALTSKPYKFKARSWELSHTDSIDVSDAVGSNIRVDSRGAEVMRILPRLNEDINEEWISDKTRHLCDGLKNQRIDQPYIRKDGKLKPASWSEAITCVAKKMSELKGSEIGAVVGGLIEAESMMVLYDLIKHFKSPNLDCMQENIAFDLSNRGNYLFNTTISGIEDSDLCLMIGCNPRHEATMINARIRKRWCQGSYPIYLLGDKGLDLTYPYQWLGDDAHVLADIASGKHEVCKVLSKAKKPMIIIGYGMLMRYDNQKLLALCSKISEKYHFVSKDWNGFNVLHLDASRVAALDLGFVPGARGLGAKSLFDHQHNKDIKFIYLLGADEVNIEAVQGEKFIVYQGHHGDKAANAADVVLPGLAYTEKRGTYVNLEGRVQQTIPSVQGPGEAKEDSLILLMLAKKLKVELSYSTPDQVRETLFKRNKYVLNQLKHCEWHSCGDNKGKINDQPLDTYKQSYYLSNVICRASRTMLSCAQEFEAV